MLETGGDKSCAKEWPKYTTAEVSNHRTAEDLWLICRTRDPKSGSYTVSHVLDVSTKAKATDAGTRWSSPLFKYGHPGGDSILLQRAGTDVTSEFHFTVLHSEGAVRMLGAFKVGEVSWTAEEMRNIGEEEKERRKKEGGGGCSIC